MVSWYALPHRLLLWLCVGNLHFHEYSPQSAIKSNTAKPKKEKKAKKKRWDDDDEIAGEDAPTTKSVGFADGAGPGEGSDGEAKGAMNAQSHGEQMTAEELADLGESPS